MVKPVEIDVAPRERIPLRFRMKDGKVDQFLMLPPKGSLSIGLVERTQSAGKDGDYEAVLEEINALFRDGLGKKQYAHLQERLNDPDDPLDLVHLVRALEGMAAAVVDSPTTSSSD